MGEEGVLRAALPSEVAGWRLDRALAVAFPAHSREQLKRLVASGSVLLDGAVARDPKRKTAGGESVEVALPTPRPMRNEAQDIALDVVFEDEHLLVVNKPAGLVVHPAAGNLDRTLVNALLHHCRGSLSGIGGVARPGIVHRIDKDTSGLLVVAKNDVAHLGLAAQFKAHSIRRRYLAVTAGLPRAGEGSVDASLARSDANRKKMAVVSGTRGKRAVTHWRLLEPLRQAGLVECRLETGRTHQVRVHMAHLGHPLLGDPVYGRPRPEHRSVLDTLAFRRQALHAAGLGFAHPVLKRDLDFSAPLPADMQALLSALSL